MSDGDFSILGMAGSLRRRSFNRALLREASELSPEDIRVDIFELAPVPPYNADLDESLGGGPYPQPVRELREGVDRSDAVLMVVPEYNWASGVLKNAVDWLRGPPAPHPSTRSRWRWRGLRRGRRERGEPSSSFGRTCSPRTASCSRPPPSSLATPGAGSMRTCGWSMRRRGGSSAGS